MSVVHIKSRFTGNEQEFEANSASDKSKLFASQGTRVESFSVDLTVGDRWSERYGPNSSEMHRVPEGGIHLARHGSIVVSAAEKIRVPHNMYGILVPTGSLFLDRGILIAPAKVEPSYKGYLKLRLFNTTQLKHSLKKGDKLGSVVFFATETTSFQPEVSKGSTLAEVPTPWLKLISGWVKKNLNQVITWLVTLVAGSMAAALTTHFYLQRALPDQASTVRPSANVQSAATPVSAATTTKK